ncbi:MAG: hypothetical protein C4542_01865 [Dehalococcoidia bacterium]|nr:MAG: hypothetical protein C4542_01865 [Dehalococcoidia bacterium]
MADLWGDKPKSKRQNKVDTLSRNRKKGKAGEDIVKLRHTLRVEEVERAPKGKDFTVRERNLITGRVTRTTHIEVKTGKAKLSPLQKKTKQSKSNYKVERVNPPPFSF